MTNEQKYKTAEERVKACTEFLKTHKEYDRVPYIEAAFDWLTLEAEEEKPENCPFCEAETLGVEEKKQSSIGIGDMKLCNEMMKFLVGLLCCFALGGFIANQMKLAFRLADDNTTLTGWTVLEDRADYDWCHAWIGSRSDVIEDGMVETEKFGNVYIYKRRH